MRRSLALLLATVTAIAVVAAACSGGGSGNTTQGSSVRVSGVLVDWRTGAAVDGSVLRSVGIQPVLEVEGGEDGSFELSGVPINGYVILDISAPGYVRTLSPTILVDDEDVTGLVIEVLAAGDASSIVSGFGITAEGGHGMVLGRVLQSNGEGYPAVAAIQILPVTFDSDGPHFLDSSESPAPSLTETSESGAFAFFNVGTGNIAVQASAPGEVLSPVASVVRNFAWSLVTIGGQSPDPTGTVTATPTPGETPGPQSFSADIRPIFENRGCTGCHKAGGTGNQIAGFRLDNVNSDWAECVTEISPRSMITRVNLLDPEASLLLTRPTFEDPPDQHPNAIFQTPLDPDYQKILRWITDGALDN